MASHEEDGSAGASGRDAGPIVGIDLGTTNSLVAVAGAGGPRVIARLPSVVRYSEGGVAEAVGEGARERAVEFAERTVASVKRLMGRSLADAAGDVDALGYEVVEGAHATARVRLPGRDEPVSPQEVSAEILRELRARAERELGTSIERAVVTVPAYFDDAQRQATRDAGRLAGLDVVRIVNEPTAAALAYGIGVGARKKQPDAETIAVYDLGGGTFDISILKVIPGEDALHGAGGDSFFQVLATGGDTRLGGDDIDRAIMDLVLGDLRGRAGDRGVSVSRQLDAGHRQALRLLAERTKIRLSEADEAAIALDLDGERLERTLSRAEFEKLIAPIIDRTVTICRRVLSKAQLGVGEIDRVVMVGGSTRIPLVRARVGELFGAEPYVALDPDEVVALGAGVQASVLAGETTDLLLLDVIPLSLGIETAGGAVSKLITSGSTVPARATELFSTQVDGQRSIKLNVVQGEREMVADCRSLGAFHLRGLPAMPAGMPQVEVAFRVDANGVLDVRAVEKRSGVRAELQVVPNHGLTREEVERIERESLANARDDMTRHRIVDLVANSKLDIRWIEDRLDALGGDLDAAYAGELRGLVEELRTTVSKAESDWRSVDADGFYTLKQTLDERSVRLHELSIARSLGG